MSKEQTLLDLKNAAKRYHAADAALGRVCNETNKDPIACTVFARKGIYIDCLPEESFTAAYWLNELVRLHGELVQVWGMSSHAVRSEWVDILNYQ